VTGVLGKRPASFRIPVPLRWIAATLLLVWTLDSLPNLASAAGSVVLDLAGLGTARAVGLDDAPTAMSGGSHRRFDETGFIVRVASNDGRQPPENAAKANTAERKELILNILLTVLMVLIIGTYIFVRIMLAIWPPGGRKSRDGDGISGGDLGGSDGFSGGGGDFGGGGSTGNW